MNPFDAVVLGIVQGLTEFLPISSSAHVQIAQQLLGLGDMSKPQLTAFIATIQLGTEAAVVIYFWKDIVRIVRAFFGSLFSRAKQDTDQLRDVLHRCPVDDDVDQDGHGHHDQARHEGAKLQGCQHRCQPYQRTNHELQIGCET